VRVARSMFSVAAYYLRHYDECLWMSVAVVLAAFCPASGCVYSKFLAPLHISRLLASSTLRRIEPPLFFSIISQRSSTSLQCNHDAPAPTTLCMELIVFAGISRSLITKEAAHLCRHIASSMHRKLKPRSAYRGSLLYTPALPTQTRHCLAGRAASHHNLQQVLTYSSRNRRAPWSPARCWPRRSWRPGRALLSSSAGRGQPAQGVRRPPALGLRRVPGIPGTRAPTTACISC